MALHTILIVEDESAVSSTLSAILRRSGFKTLLAEDAVSSVAEARRSLPDLILLDLGLHTAGDGFMVMERLQKLPLVAGIPIMVISGQDRRLVEHRVLTNGAVAFFQKPLDVRSLLEALWRLLPGSRPAGLWSATSNHLAAQQVRSSNLNCL